MKKEDKSQYDNEISRSINSYIRNCSEEQKTKDVNAFDEMCRKFKNK